MNSPRFDVLDDWLSWQERCHPSAIDLGLERVRQVAVCLELLRPSAKVITVAGTNGKGSCVAALSWWLRRQGARVGAYTSPHLVNYNERVQVDGQLVSDQALCSAFAAIDQARGNISLTYFEFATLAALYLFAQETLDYWILEVGLGGRLDATNILTPDLTIITSVALDHIEWLGDNREAIGYEKAGICRAGVPLIVADPQPPQSVLSHAETLSCPSYWIDQQFEVIALNSGWQVRLGERIYPIPGLQLPPWSVAAALQAADLLGRLGDPSEVGDDLVELADIQLPGRLQRCLVKGRTLVLDVAHNPAATLHLAEQLQARWPEDTWQIIVTMMADKNISEALLPLVPLAHTWHLTTVPNLPRAASAAQLAEVLDQMGARGVMQSYEAVTDALSSVLAAGGPSPILVTGSFYAVADALRYLDRLEMTDEIHG